MQLEHLSRHCIIIGAFGFTVCLAFILIEVPKLYSAYRGLYENSTPYVKRSSLMIVANAVGALLSILAIIGVKKRSPIAMAPALLAVFGIAAYFLYDSAMRIGPLSTLRLFDNLFYPTIVLGFSSIILYPLVTVFLNIRHEKSCEGIQPGQNKEDVVKI